MRKPRRVYSSQEKKAVLAQLALNHGKVALTSLETGIPRRTLQRWRANLDRPGATWPNPQDETPREYPANFRPTWPNNPDLMADFRPALANNPELMAEFRHQFIAKMRLIFQSIDDSIATASLAEQVNAVTRIFDRIVKLSSPDIYAPHPSQIVSYEIIGSETFEPDDDEGYDDEERYLPESDLISSADQPLAVDPAPSSITDFAR
jgi:transposase-like protein